MLFMAFFYLMGLLFFLYLVCKLLSDPEKREEIMQDARENARMSKERKAEKKRQKEQAWRETAQDWMLSDIWWNSFKGN